MPTAPKGKAKPAKKAASRTPAKKGAPTRKAAASPATASPAAPAAAAGWTEVAPAAPAPTQSWTAGKPAMREEDQRTYAMFLHLSAFAGILIGAGLLFIAGPLLMWLLKREESPFIDRHGRAALNFHLNVLVLILAAVVLVGLVAVATFGIGLLLLMPVLIIAVLALAVVLILFPIQAAIAAKEGRECRYPAAIRFLGPEPAPRAPGPAAPRTAP